MPLSVCKLLGALYEEEIGLLQDAAAPNNAIVLDLFAKMVVSGNSTEFLILPAYDLLD